MIATNVFVRHLSTGNRRFLTRAFGKYLIITNTVSSGFLMGTGDVFQQTLHRITTDEKLKIDWDRTGRMFVIGLVLGPVVHFWYTGLDKYLPGKAKKTILKKLLADQLVASPTFLFLFFMGMGRLEGSTLNDTLKEFKEKFPFMYLVEWIFWPPAQAINFLYLPPHFRVVYVNCLILGWDCFLSYMKHKDQKLPGMEIHAA